MSSNSLTNLFYSLSTLISKTGFDPGSLFLFILSPCTGYHTSWEGWGRGSGTAQLNKTLYKTLYVYIYTAVCKNFEPLIYISSDGSRICCYGATVAPLLTKWGPILIQKGNCKITQNIKERYQRNPNQLIV